MQLTNVSKARSSSFGGESEAGHYRVNLFLGPKARNSVEEYETHVIEQLGKKLKGHFSMRFNRICPGLGISILRGCLIGIIFELLC